MDSNESDALRIAMLIGKHRQQTLTQAEEIELVQWLSRDPQNSRLLAQLNDEKYITNSLEQIARFNTNRAFERIKQRIQTPDKKPAVLRTLYKRIAAIAASVIVVSLLFINRYRLADLLHPTRYEHVATVKGERKTIKLSDGTTVWLGPASSLNYPQRFTAETRQVQLSGEGFLEVAKDHRHPFIVHTANATTTVLGTSFDIKAYSDEKTITVTLLTGKVSFSNGISKVLILPNQRAIYQKAQNVISKQDYPDAQNMISRRDGKLQYDNAPVSEIIADLRRNYNLNIVTEGDVGNCEFYGRINDGEDAESFLRKLCRAIGADVNKNGNTYIISGGACQ